MSKNKLPLILFGAGLILVIIHFVPIGGGNLNASIKHSEYIMPSCYKVYANADALNGEYYLFKMLLTNDGKAPINNVKVSYRIPNYIDWTDLENVPKIYPGQNTIIKCYPQFKDDIVNKMTQSQEKVEIKITYAGGSKDESYGFKMMGRNQFVYTDLPPEEIASYPDMFRNDPLMGCLVTPNDPIVKYYAQQVQEKVMKGEQASVSGKAEDGVKFMKGLYAATLISHMVYSGAEGIPQKMGDISSMVQSIRLPREVVTGNTGLCVEFALMYASIFKVAGLHPVIFMIPGHAYPGIIAEGKYYAIEATGVGGEGLGSRSSPDAAFTAGMKELETWVSSVQAGDNRYSVVDIDNVESKGVVPMELRDDEFLRKKVDDIALTFSGGGRNNEGQQQQQDYVITNNGGGGNRTTGTSTRSYNGVIGFTYPATWSRHDHPIAQWPFLVTYINSRDRTSEIDVYNLNGASSADQAMAYIRQQFAAAGINVLYQKSNVTNGYTLFQGTTTSRSGSGSWIGVFRNSGNGIVGVTMGGQNYAAKASLFNAIIATIH